jgi:hypothetical protein
MADESNHAGPPGPEHIDHHDITRAEHDTPPNTKVIGLVVATVVILVVCVIAIVQYFDMSVSAEVDRKVLSRPSRALEALRATETLKLTRYAWVDQPKGVVRIPVARAAELVMNEWESRPSELVAWVDEAAATPPAPPQDGAPTAPPPGAPAAPPQDGAPAAPQPGAPAAPQPGAPAQDIPTPEAPREPPTPAPPAPTGTTPTLQHPDRPAQEPTPR